MITMNNLYNERMKILSGRMHLGLQPDPDRFGTDVFGSNSVFPTKHLSYDIISPLTPPSHTPINNTACNPQQSQSNIPYSGDVMFSMYNNFGRSDLSNSFGTSIGLAQSRTSEPEVESSVDESAGSSVHIANSLTTHDSNFWINILASTQKPNEALLPVCNKTSRVKRAHDLEPLDKEFTRDEAKKIAANEKLAEMALADPKRVKRILANRQSAARSKEKKMRYVVELENKVHKLQKEIAALSAQLNVLQSGKMGLDSRNNELRIRLDALGQQSQLQKVLNEALQAEVQHLKLEAGELMT